MISMIFSSSFYPFFNVVVVYEVASFAEVTSLSNNSIFQSIYFPSYIYSKMEAIGRNPLMAITLNNFNAVIYKLQKKGYIEDNYILFLTIYLRIEKSIKITLIVCSSH